MRPIRPSSLAVVALVALSAARAGAQQPSARLLVLDQDAEPVSAASAGALFNVDVGAGTAATPGIEAAATTGAPFGLPSGVAISPIDGRAYIADPGVPGSGTPRILAVDGATGATEVIAEGAPLSAPYALAFMPDGRLAIADKDADPSLIGPSIGCGNHGAIFVIDTVACAPPCTPAVLSDGRLASFSLGDVSAFGDPYGVAYDPVSDSLYVADSCASELGWFGSLFRVHPSTGSVDLVSSTDQFLLLINVKVRPDGTPLLVDQGTPGDSVIWTIDLGNTDPETNAEQLTGGTQYSQLQDVSIDAANRVYAVDWGEWNDTTQTFDIPPVVWYVDETDPNPGTNGRKINESESLVTPVSCAIVPVPEAASVTPALITGPTNVVIEGSNLHPGLTIDFGPNVAVAGVDWAPGFPVGTALQALITPTSTAVVPVGCSGGTDLTLTNAFGGTSVLVNAVGIVANTGGIVPMPPFSTKGDANRDLLVDGIDLAILGRHFGAEYCDGFAFANDADFTNDDIIDGADLAILAAYFGARF